MVIPNNKNMGAMKEAFWLFFCLAVWKRSVWMEILSTTSSSRSRVDFTATKAIKFGDKIEYSYNLSSD